MLTPQAEGYTERKVDLNDYFNSSNGWDDDTDWNSAGLEDGGKSLIVKCEDEKYTTIRIIKLNMKNT